MAHRTERPGGGPQPWTGASPCAVGGGCSPTQQRVVALGTQAARWTCGEVLNRSHIPEPLAALRRACHWLKGRPVQAAEFPPTPRTLRH